MCLRDLNGHPNRKRRKTEARKKEKSMKPAKTGSRSFRRLLGEGQVVCSSPSTQTGIQK